MVEAPALSVARKHTLTEAGGLSNAALQFDPLIEFVFSQLRPESWAARVVGWRGGAVASTGRRCVVGDRGATFRELEELRTFEVDVS